MLLFSIGVGAAIALLFIIHLFGLRLRQKIEFSHIHFLSNLISKTKSLKKVNSLLLLLLRSATVLSFLLGFYIFLQEFKEREVNSIDDGTYIVDNSWSMQSKATPSGPTLLQTVFTEIGSIQKEAITVKVNNGKLLEDSLYSLGSFSFTSDQIIKSINDGENSSEILIFSDFQKASLTKEALRSLPKQKPITLIPYSSPLQNFYIDSVWITKPIILPEIPFGLTIRIKGIQNNNSGQVKITASQGNQLIGTAQTMIEPSGKGFVTFQVKGSGHSSTKITLALDDPNTLFDNHFFVVIPKANKITIQAPSVLPNSHPLILAYKEEPGFAINQSPVSLSTFLVADMKYVNQQSAIENIANDVLTVGGTVVFIPHIGNQKVLLQTLGNLGVPGVQEAGELGESKSIKFPDMSDAFFQGIFEKQVKNLKMPQESPVLVWANAYHNILKFQDNQPFLSSFKIKRGVVHLLASSLEGSSFASHPLMVPIFYKLALTNQIARHQLSTSPVEGVINIPLGNVDKLLQPFSLSNGNQSFIPNQSLKQGTLSLTLPNELNQPGFYDLKSGERVITTIAINIPKEESLIAGYSSDELKDIFSETHPNVMVLEPNGRLPLQKLLEKDKEGNTLWKYCLILCLICLLLEAIILSKKQREVFV